MTIDAFTKREFYDWISYLDYLIDGCNDDGEAIFVNQYNNPNNWKKQTIFFKRNILYYEVIAV